MNLALTLGQMSDRLTMRFLDYVETAPVSSMTEAEALSIIRKAQICAIVSLSPAMMIANICSAFALILLVWRTGTLTPATCVWGFVVLIFAGYGLFRAHVFARSASRRGSSRRAPGKIVISSFTWALIWTYPFLFVMLGGGLLETVFISTLTAGMIAGGVLALYPVPLAALAYTAILTATAVPQVLVSATEQTLPFTVVIIAFTAFILLSVKRHAGQFLSELLRKLAAERQRDSVSMLLESYQGTDGQYLWSSDESLQLKTDLAPLAQVLGLCAQPDTSNNLTDLLLSCDARPYDSSAADILSNLLSDRADRPDHFELRIVANQNSVFKLVGRKAQVEGGWFVGYNGYLKDVTTETRAQEEIYRLATRDAMTGLLNYTEFTRRSGAMMSCDKALGDTKVAIFLFIDADNLKAVNDTLGHAAGDSLLATIAGRLRDLLPDSSLIARKGGDEFLALVECKNVRDAERIAQLALSALNQNFRSADNDVPLSCSVGASIHLSKKASLEQLELEADRALYHAKSLGKRQLTIYDSLNGSQIGQDRVLARDLADAVRRGDFHLEFQPIVRSADLRIVGAEALLRWFHPELGLVDPEKIVEIAAKRGNGSGVLDFVLRHACDAALSWPDHTFVSVNVLAGDLQRHNFATQILTTLEEIEFPGGRLWLELTESEILENNSVVLDNLNTLRAAGITIAIDDFGAGYSSLSYLDHFPLDVVKVDKSLVRDCYRRESSRIIMNAIKKLAAANDFRVVAEGIESDLELKTVVSVGADLMQGFALYDPLSQGALVTQFARREEFPEEKATAAVG